MEALQNRLSLLRFSLVRDRRDEEAAGTWGDRGVVGCEDQNTVLAMAVEQMRQGLQFRRRGLGDALLLTVGQERGSAFRRAARLLNEPLPTTRRAHRDAARVNEGAVLLACLPITFLLLGWKFDVYPLRLVNGEIVAR